MAGFNSQQGYEAELLSTYLRKGRVSPISKKDIDLALSIYKMPQRNVSYKNEKKLTFKTARAAGKGKSDMALMNMSTRAVLNKATDTRRVASLAKTQAKTAQAKRQAAAQSATTARQDAAARYAAARAAGLARASSSPTQAAWTPPPSAPPAVPNYSGPLTPTLPRTITTPRSSGYTAPRRTGTRGFTPR